MPHAYSSGSGQPIYGGRSAPSSRPAWRTAMAANTWAQVPGNTLSSIDPENNGAINPAGAGNQAPWHLGNSQAGIITDWCGMCWDESTCRLISPPNGGHSGYGGNEPYLVDLTKDTTTWQMLRNPSGAIGDVITLNTTDGSDVTGLYSDGYPRPGHSYNYHVFVPGMGPVTVGIYAPFPNSNQSRKIFLLDTTTGLSTVLADPTGISNGNWGSTGQTGGAAYDSLRHCIWILNTGTASLLKFDLTSYTVTVANSYDNFAGNYAKLVYLPEYDMLAVFHSGGSGYKTPFFMFDLANSFAVIQPTVTGAWSAGLGASLGQTGAAWNGSQFLLWNNATSTTDISALAPTGNPRTAPWAKSVISAAGGITPTAATPNGTYGRFGYTKTLGGCFLLNATNQPIQFYATE